MKILTIKKRQHFVKIAKFGDKFACRGMVLQIMKNTDSKENLRFGFTATKKLGNAVIRNRVKRRLRAIVRENIKKINVNCSYDIVIIGRYSTANRNYRDLSQDFLYCLKKLGLKINK